MKSRAPTEERRGTLRRATARLDLMILARAPASSPVLRAALRDVASAAATATAELSDDAWKVRPQGAQALHLKFLETACRVLEAWRPERRPAVAQEARMLDAILAASSLPLQYLAVACRARRWLFRDAHRRSSHCLAPREERGTDEDESTEEPDTSSQDAETLRDEEDSSSGSE